MEGVRQMGAWLKNNGHTIEVVTLDAPDSVFLKDYPLKTHALGPSYSGYCFNKRLTPWLKVNAEKYDRIIINGLWQYQGFGAWRALRKSKIPYYVYSHGMLDPWFKEAYPFKHLKKWLYWPWAEYRVLRDAKAVVFTCEEERILARKSFWLYKVNEAVTSYGTSTPPQDADRLKAVFFDAFPALKEKRIFLFLSRIHEKKGLDLLITAFSSVALQDPKLQLVIAGPDSTNLMPALKMQADLLGISDRITWPGMLQGDLKWGAYHSAEAFVLSSHQENFGIVVAEALGCGLPTLISNKINIWREIEADGAGIVNADTVDGTIDTLNKYLSMTESAKKDMRQNARECFSKRYTVDAMALSLLKIIA